MTNILCFRSNIALKDLKHPVLVKKVESIIFIHRASATIKIVSRHFTDYQGLTPTSDVGMKKSP